MLYNVWWIEIFDDSDNAEFIVLYSNKINIIILVLLQKCVEINTKLKKTEPMKKIIQFFKKINKELKIAKKEDDANYRRQHNLPEDACIDCNGDGHEYGPEQGEINNDCVWCNGTGKIKI